MSLYSEIKDEFFNRETELNTTTIFKLVRVAMEKVDNISEMTGKEKKENVKDVVKRIIENAVPDQLQVLENILTYSMDAIIDNFVDISHGNLKIHQDKVENFCCC